MSVSAVDLKWSVHAHAEEVLGVDIPLWGNNG